MNLLAGALRQKSTMIYAAVIILSTNITLAFAINNFIFDNDYNYNYMNSLFSITAVLVTAYLLCLLYSIAVDKSQEEEAAGDLTDNTAQPSSLPENTAAASVREEPSAASGLYDLIDKKIILSAQEMKATEESKEAYERNEAFETKEANELKAASQINSDYEIKEASEIKEAYEQKEAQVIEDALLRHAARTSYELLCDLNNELIGKLKAFSEALYTHSVRIGNLSYRAALEVGADEMLALAGGLYHEIGKISGKNYIEEGMILAEDYSFPRELKAILRQHNIKYDKPGSVEAAIVMLSDSVVSTIEYIEKNGDHKFTTNKIIDNIFQMRMDKGTFDEASLTLMDYKKLRDFYQKEFSGTGTGESIQKGGNLQ
jgi:putative nucleotidyltransferase with HDIG domain